MGMNVITKSIQGEVFSASVSHFSEELCSLKVPRKQISV